MEYVEVARAQDARGELVLRRRSEDNAGDVLELRVNGVFVMDTRETSTERALAEIALAQVTDPRNVLVGGLGLGFTTRAVLEDVRVERVVVVEIEGVLVEWMRDGTVPHGPEFLADARLSIANLDVAHAVEELTPAASTWCCWTSTTAPATWSTTPMRGSTAPSSSPPYDADWHPAGCSRSGRPTRRPSSRPRSERRTTRSAHSSTTWTSRAGPSTTGCTSRAAGTWRPETD